MGGEGEEAGGLLFVCLFFGTKIKKMETLFLTPGVSIPTLLTPHRVPCTVIKIILFHSLQVPDRSDFGTIHTKTKPRHEISIFDTHIGIRQ